MMRFDLFRLTARQLVGAHRLGLVIFLALLALLPVIMAEGAIQAERFQPSQISPEQMLQDFFIQFQLPFLYPIIMLIFASIALRDEITNNTIDYLWVKPVSRSSVVLSKFGCAFLLSVLFAVPSAMLTAMILGGIWQTALNLSLVTIASLLAYGSFAFALSLFLRRSILVGFFYILIWETLLRQVSPLASQLSIRHYAQNLGFNVQGLPSELDALTSLAVLMMVAALCLVLSVWRFSTMEFLGEME